MRASERLFIILTSLVLLVVGAALIGVATRSEVSYFFVSLLEQPDRDVQAGELFIGILFILLAFYLARLGLGSRRRQRAIVRGTSLGEVRVSLAAIENLVRRSARQVKGIREVETFVDGTQDGIEIVLSILVVPDVNIPALCDEVQARLEEYVRETVGVPVTQVRVNVRNISGEQKTRVE